MEGKWFFDKTRFSMHTFCHKKIYSDVATPRYSTRSYYSTFCRIRFPKLMPFFLMVGYPDLSLQQNFLVYQDHEPIFSNAVFPKGQTFFMFWAMRSPKKPLHIYIYNFVQDFFPRDFPRKCFLIALNIAPYVTVYAKLRCLHLGVDRMGSFRVILNFRKILLP